MNYSDSEKAADGFDAEAFRQVQCVVVAVPSEDAALAEECRHFGGRVIGKPDRNRRATLMKLIWIADAEKLQAWKCEQAWDQTREQGHLVLARRAIGREQCAAAVLCCGIATPAQLGEVIDRRSDACD